jgi:hypothetical protein
MNQIARASVIVHLNGVVVSLKDPMGDLPFFILHRGELTEVEGTNRGS